MHEYKKSTNLESLYLLPKIRKCLSNVPGRPVISNFGALTEKASQFLGFHLKSVMQNEHHILKIPMVLLKVTSATKQ